jgi:hypothetical protein
MVPSVVAEEADLKVRTANEAPGIVETDAFWASVQADYEADAESVEAVAGKYGISKSRLLYRAKQRHWRPRNKHKGGGTASLLARLFRLVEKQIYQMESETSPMGEKEAAALGKVAATLENLIQIERASAPPKTARRQSKDLVELRNKIAQRFEEIATESGPGQALPPE